MDSFIISFLIISSINLQLIKDNLLPKPETSETF